MGRPIPSSDTEAKSAELRPLAGEPPLLMGAEMLAPKPVEPIADAPAAPKSDGLYTLMELAKLRGDSNSFVSKVFYDPARVSDAPIDPYAQRGPLFQALLVHTGWAVDRRLSEAEYDDAMAEVMGIPFGEQVAPTTSKEG